MVESIILLGLFIILVAIRIPIAYTLGISAVATALYMGMDPIMLIQRMSSGLQSFPLITIPLFILAGVIMAKGGVAQRIVDFAYILVGWMPGGLAMVNCLDSMFFGGVSGSSVADIASTGPIMIPMMEKKGYDRAFATSLTVATSTVGIIVPPSHNVVLYAMVVGGTSIAALFAAGIIPGIMMGLFLAITCYFVAIKRGYPCEKPPPLKESLIIARDGILSGLAIVIIVGGIVFGVFTATEASAVAVIYSLFLAMVVYREMKVKDIWPVLISATKTTGIIMMLIGCATAFGYLMTILQVPTHVANFFLSITKEPVMLLLLMNLLLLFLGCIMDVAPLILIMTPVLLPLAKIAGMNEITFGIMLMVNLAIGLTTPPVGNGLFVGCAIGNISMEKASKAMLVLWPAMLLVLALTTYIPWVTTYLPSIFK